MGSKKYTNRLSLESSPYLQQHAHNPIDWYPWGDEALEKAQKEDKLIIISIGYAACHWCHVMEHESFESKEVAQFMNDHFVAIKVDREERPDIDQVYMSAVNMLTGSGGWPLNAIALPDGRPIWGGTYFPKRQWLSMLGKVLQFATRTPENAQEQAEAITSGIGGSEIPLSPSSDSLFPPTTLEMLWDNWQNQIDFIAGGTKGAPKFPLPIGYNYLLSYAALTDNKKVQTAVNITLEKMGNGGIYDQIGGGFARYSTDEKWLAPHFEKMLYDNGQLLTLYAKAFQKNKKKRYAEIIDETITFAERELLSPYDLYYASLDADSEGVEGKYYVWSKKEIEEILQDDAELCIAYFGISQKGNWESTNIVVRPDNIEELTTSFSLSVDEIDLKITTIKQKLLNEREKRVHPSLDNKILTSWNALFLKGLVDSYIALQNNSYLEKAIKGANALLNNLSTDDGGLYRCFTEGKPSINGFLDEYAFTIELFISLYEVTFDEKWLLEADRLTIYAQTHFKDPKGQQYYYTSDLDKALITRKIDVMDNVIPSGNSQMANNLYRLGTILQKDSYTREAKEMLLNVSTRIPTGQSYFSNWATLLMLFQKGTRTIAITGANAIEKRATFAKQFLANTIFMGGRKQEALPIHEGREFTDDATIYVCKDKSCLAPTQQVNEALALLQ